MSSDGNPGDITTKEPSTKEKIVVYIPEYKGYEEKETRRETERLVRGKASRHIGSAVRTAERALARAMGTFGVDKSKVTSKLVFELNYIYNKVSKVPSGYSGLSDVAKVKEEDTDKLIDHDFTMITLAEEIENKGKELLELTMRGDYGSISKAIEELHDTISKIEDIMAARESVLKGT